MLYCLNEGKEMVEKRSRKFKFSGITLLGLFFPVIVASQAVIWGAAFIVIAHDHVIATLPVFDDSVFVQQGWWGWLMVIGGIATITGMLAQWQRVTRSASFITACLFFYGSILSVDSEFGILWAPLLLSHFLAFGYIHMLTTIQYMNKVTEGGPHDITRSEPV